MGHRKRAGVVLAVAMAASAAFGGCGDDDGSTATSRDAAPGDLAAYCDAAFAWDTPPDPENHEFDEEWFESVLVPRFDALEAEAPDGLLGDVATVRAALEGGDEAEGEAAAGRIHEFSVANCGWASQTVTATEYAFEGVPDEVPAGIVSFEVVNHGNEAHMLEVVRRNDGVTAPFAELLALPEDEFDELVEGFEPEAFLDPGDEGFVVADLGRGAYALVCELPVGTPTLEEIEFESDAPSHAAEGMVHEFTVE